MTNVGFISPLSVIFAFFEKNEAKSESDLELVVTRHGARDAVFRKQNNK